MFREIVRKKQELSIEKCLEILQEEKRGELSLLGDDGYPYGVPINHYYDPEDEKLYFHGGKSGHRIDAARRCPKASYCVIDQGEKDPEEWFLHFNSVIVFGQLEMIEDEKIIAAKSRALSYKFTKDDQYIQKEIDRSLAGTSLMAMKIEHISGKHIREK